MKALEFKKYPVAFLAGLVLLATIVLAGLILEVKKAQSLVFTEWARLRYLAYLLRTEAPPKKPPLSAEALKEKLVSQGFNPEAVRDGPSGVEVEMELSWKDLARLLSWLSSRNLQVKAFQAQDTSGTGNFRLRMVLK